MTHVDEYTRTLSYPVPEESDPVGINVPAADDYNRLADTVDMDEAGGGYDRHEFDVDGR